jgi:hypothetical protein
MSFVVTFPFEMVVPLPSAKIICPFMDLTEYGVFDKELICLKENYNII